MHIVYILHKEYLYIATIFEILSDCKRNKLFSFFLFAKIQTNNNKKRIVSIFIYKYLLYVCLLE